MVILICCRNSCFLSQKSTNNTTGMVSRQRSNLQVIFSRLSSVWLYNLNVHKLTNAILTWTFEHFFTVLNSLCIQIIQRQIAQHIKKSRITASSVIILRTKESGCFILRYTKKVYQQYEAGKVTECLCYIQMYILEMHTNILFSTHKNYSLSNSTFFQMRSHTLQTTTSHSSRSESIYKTHTLVSSYLKQRKSPTKSKLIIKSFYAFPPNEYQPGKVETGVSCFFICPE